MLKTIIMDFDGLIVDTEVVWYRIYVEWFRVHKQYDLSVQEFLACVGSNAEDLFRKLDAKGIHVDRDAFAQDVIGTRIDRSDLSSEDRAFATKLALGVVSATGTLDEIIDRALNAPSDVKPDVRDALRVSTYEIIFLGKTPHAAVDQGVELVRSFAMSASGLANAVLRKIVLMRQAFPFGDPMRDPEALARLHAFPLWLARKLIVDLGPQEALDFMRASNEQAPLFIAVNAAKTSDEALVKAFDKLDEGLDPVSVDGVSVAGCYRVLDTRALLLPEVKRMFSQGKILVTDAASQLVAA